MEHILYRAAVGALIVNEFRELLITHNFGHEGRWNFPRGGLAKGESQLEALNRELFEELGTKDFRIICKSRITQIFTLPEDYISKHKLPYIGQAQSYYWVFVSKKTKFNIPNSEVEQYKWIKPDSKLIKKYLGTHDEDGTFQKLIPLEVKELV